jgi:plastocyanin
MTRLTHHRTHIALAVALIFAAGGSTATAADEVKVEITIKDHRFQPAEVRVPAGKPLVVKVRNRDATPEEFESKTLRVEKVIVGNSEGILTIRPLEPGRYRFYGEFHEDTAQGVLIAE